MPRSSRCAAAASPTGPPPMMATGNWPIGFARSAPAVALWLFAASAVGEAMTVMACSLEKLGKRLAIDQPKRQERQCQPHALRHDETRCARRCDAGKRVRQ